MKVVDEIWVSIRDSILSERTNIGEEIIECVSSRNLAISVHFIYTLFFIPAIQD